MNAKISKITPMRGRIVVLPDPAPEKTDSGLFIPDTVKRAPDSGIVTHVAEGSLFKKGDHVLFARNAGVELHIEPVHLLMPEDDVYATI